jgi:hypothetical protein
MMIATRNELTTKPAQAVHHHYRPDRPQESGQRNQPETQERHTQRQQHRQRGSESRPGSSTDHIRIGHRIPKQALKQRPGSRQGSPDESPTEHSRHPDLEYDRLFNGLPAGNIGDDPHLVQKHFENTYDGNVGRADTQR